MKFFKLIILTGAGASLLIAINMYRFDYGLEDAVYRTLFSPMEGTVWASNFSEKAFNSVRLGMISHQVMDILGEPLKRDKECKGDYFWPYTWQDTPTADFDQRWIVFNENYKVSEKRKSFYID